MTVPDAALLLQKLEARVTALERRRFRCPDGVAPNHDIRRARAAVEDAGLYSSRWKWVPPSYYEWPLEKRAAALGAPSTFHLCKSLVLENRKVTDNPDTEDFRTNPRFLMVVIQYETSLNVKKLATSLRKLQPADRRQDESQFDFRIASSEDNDCLTGYTHNSVTPFGTKKRIPIVLSASVVPLQYFWMGGGHVHLKLGMSVDDFCKHPDVQVMELTEARDPNQDIDEE